MVEPNVIEARIREGISGVSHIQVEDLTGTKDHYRATVVATAFADKSRIEQHQMIYGALGELMAGPVHALSLNTFTPDAWENKEG